jgi:hypothetical protein
VLDSRAARRRWFGAFFLTSATALLIWGQTVFEPYLSGLGFICYWLICFLLTVMAIVTALTDAVMLRRQSRKERRALIERTLGEFTSRREPQDSAAGEASRPPGRS